MATQLPAFIDSVDLRYLLEPLGGLRKLTDYLESFPDSLYNKNPDSHFVRLMTALLGASGIGSLHSELLLARLRLEAHGAQLADLDAFYGDPFSFGRILDDSYEQDTGSLLTSGVWAQIRAQDEMYRSRAIQFLGAARLGGTPQGMRLAARSGTGQSVAIIENYRYLYDIHTDLPLGLDHYGQSADLGEFIVVPEAEVSRTSVQTITFDPRINAGHYVLSWEGASTPLPGLAWNASAIQVQNALQATPLAALFGPGALSVTGGPGPSPIVITFIGAMSNQAVTPIVLTNNLNDPLYDTVAGVIRQAQITVQSGVVDPSAEVATIGDGDKHALQDALDELRPVNSYPTYNANRSNLHNVAWNTLYATSEFTAVLRFVTGNPSITWPTVDSSHWIEPSAEIEAPTTTYAAAQHYVGYHNISSVQAYTDEALGLTQTSLPLMFATDQYEAGASLINFNSFHIGPFTPQVASVIPFLGQYSRDYTTIFGPEQALPDITEQLAITAIADDGTALINGMYPADYSSAPGVPALKYRPSHFWASRERTSGAEIFEIDLGTAQAVNYVTFETTRKPVTIEIDYDTLDQAPARVFAPIVPLPGTLFTDAIFYETDQLNPWLHLEFIFDNGLDMIFTRYIRIVLTRRDDNPTFGRFLFNPATQVQTPWSVELRNVRVGRNVAPTVL